MRKKRKGVEVPAHRPPTGKGGTRWIKHVTMLEFCYANSVVDDVVDLLKLIDSYMHDNERKRADARCERLKPDRG
jgi:hypothetical protein